MNPPLSPYKSGQYRFLIDKGPVQLIRFQPSAFGGGNYDPWWEVEDLTKGPTPNTTFMCREDKLDRELSEMEVIAWVAR
jgi:hypothetical protein